MIESASPLVDEPRWKRHLNARQREAVTYGPGSLLIVAGAGTGKTATLAARVAKLIDDGVQPNRILLLTFTRRAAQELLARAAMLGDDAATAQVWGGTFHSVANRLLRIYGAGVGLDPAFTVIDQGDSIELFGMVRADLGDTSTTRFPKKETIASIYDHVVGTQRKLDEVVRGEFPWVVPHLESLPNLFDQYTRRKRARHVLDYTDLVLFWRAMLASPDVGAQIAGRFDHILVDEFQDTDPIQADIIHAFGDAGAVVTAVGDDAQSIYGFRAATVENMWSFTSRRPDAGVVTLEDNYRSIGPILDIANAVLAQSTQHFDKTLVPVRTGTTRPVLCTCADELSQATAVADAILKLREEGIDLADQAVLFRTGYHSDLLELELGRRDIPFHKWGGLKFLEAAHVKDLVALLRVLDNPWDELAWNRVLRSLTGVGPATLRKMMAELGLAALDVSPEVVSPMNAFFADQLTVPPSAREELDSLREAFADALGHDGVEPPVASQVERLSAWCETMFERRYDRHEIRSGDLVQLQITASAYQTRSRFLTELTLEPPASTGDLADEPHMDDDFLTLSTVHSAKGCEWSAVHLIHAADGNFPADMALSSADGLEEERRLMYVALTRARDVLRVSVPLRYHHKRSGVGDAHSFAPISRFLSPLRDLFDQVSDAERSHDDAIDLAAGASVSIADEVDTSITGLWTL